MSPPKSPQQLDLEKQRSAHLAARWVADGMRVGLGSGSTSAYFIHALAARIRDERLRITGLPTSTASHRLAADLRIPLIEPARGLHLDLAVDGADEIGPKLALIKGGGAALLREKVVASAARFFLVIGDSSKLVPVLGRFPLPIETIPFAVPFVLDRLEAISAAPILRCEPGDSGKPRLTDQGNCIIDCHLGRIPDPAGLSQTLLNIPGIVDHGLFIGLASAAMIADGNQIWLHRPGSSPIAAGDRMPTA